MSFGVEEMDGRYTFYFHSAKAGRKLDILSRNPEAAFEMDTNYRLNEAPSACGYSAGFQSVIGSGRVYFARTAAEKRRGLTAIMRHSTGRDGWTFSDEACEAVCVFRLEARRLSCKEHQ